MSRPQTSRAETHRKRRERARRKRRIKRDLARRHRSASLYGLAGVRQCAKKNRYPTMETAEMVAERRTMTSGMPLRVYRCPCCGGYHITHKGAT